MQIGNLRYSRLQICATETALALCLLLAGLALPASPARAATNDLTTALQRGLFEEEANQNLGLAIQAYQSVASQFDKDRKLAATAIFRLGECYRKQGNTKEAAAHYERIVREFSDQPTLFTLSRQNLAELGSALPVPGQAATRQYTVVSGDVLSDILKANRCSIEALRVVNPGLDTARLRVGQVLQIPVYSESSISDAARQEQRRLLEEEIKLVQKQLESQQKQLQVGAVNPDALWPTEREILKLKRQVAALDAGTPLSAAPLETTATSTDADEVTRIQALIKDSPDLINAPDQKGETLLQAAAAKGKLAVVKALLDSGAAVDGLQQPGLTPLHYAAANGHKAVVDLLLSKGAKADARTEGGVTPLHLAARKGYVEVAKALLAAGAPINAKGSGASSIEDLQYSINSGQTPLHLAANGGYTSLMDLLLAKGADVNAEDSDGRTPLSYAVQKHYEPVVQRLLAAHANPNAGRINLPLAAATDFGDLPDLKLLLAHGADPNTNTMIGWSYSGSGYSNPGGGTVSPLFLAVSKKNPSAAAELIRGKADPNGVGPAPANNPLLYEALSDAPTLKALLEGGADPNVKTKEGTPMLLQAVIDNNQPAVELLLAHHAEVNCTNKDGWTPLHRAAATAFKPIAELLLKAGADVNARSEHNETPLVWAVNNGRQELAALLLANKADPNLKDDMGRTPLHEAVDRNKRELVELLLANKADPNERNNDGLTPLDLAKTQPAPPRQPLPPSRPLRLPTSAPVPTTSQPGVIPSQPPWTSANPSQPESKPKTMTDLLRQYGASDDLPRMDCISVRRASANYFTQVFTKGTNDWNQFTLLDLIGVQCDLLEALPQGGTGKAGYAQSSYFNHYRLGFPDLARLQIRRPSADLKGWQEQTIDLRPLFESGDCSKDVRLEWGNVVDIPEADHMLNAAWPGFSKTQLANLKKCLTRQVEVVINGQATNLTLAPSITDLGPGPVSQGDYERFNAQRSGEFYIISHMPFWLKPVLLESKLLLTSSDLRHVKVTRRDAASGQDRQWVVDCAEASPAPDFWLRDGDKVEVPEKTN